MTNPEGSFLVHYACGDLYMGQAPPIHIIAVRSLQAVGPQVAQVFKIESPEDTERAMLERFLAFVIDHRNHAWLVWAENFDYGIQVIWNRLRDLGGRSLGGFPHQVIPLVTFLRGLYGRDSIPSMLRLFQLNGISSDFMMRGRFEPGAYAEGRILEVENSTIQKVNSLRELLHKAHEGQFVGRTPAIVVKDSSLVSAKASLGATVMALWKWLRRWF